ncbi:MAG: hypothetical protein M3Y90_14865 [Actinomycetota bacterium]|nr:hypothetical protein [Actinomycetota bacterium]
MSSYDYQVSRTPVIAGAPFYSLIMAAMRRADTINAALLRTCWPEVWDEVQARYNAPGGVLESDPEAVQS